VSEYLGLVEPHASTLEGTKDDPMELRRDIRELGPLAAQHERSEEFVGEGVADALHAIERDCENLARDTARKSLVTQLRAKWSSRKDGSVICE